MKNVSFIFKKQKELFGQLNIIAIQQYINFKYVT